MDDKGPAIIALYAMKALKDKGFTPKKKIKLIVGCNEETGWACIEHYNKVAHMPETGISPDANFPVIYAEKGIMHLKFTFPKNGNYTVIGGGAANMVCDYCEVSGGHVSTTRLTAYNLTYQDGKVVSHGKSAHGSTPEDGINAMAPILKYLGLDEAYQLLFVEKCGLDGLEDETGKLTFSPNVISSDEQNIYITCDMRYPATYQAKDILAQVSKCNIPFTVLHEQAPLYNDKQCFLIKTLCEVYNEVTGKKMQPIAIGGGTYARALKCGAGFGPEEDGEEVVIHQPEEYITFDKIEKCFKIYTLALERLTK
jgi:succinyl-diaminopimelate desuccinylase